MPSLKQQTTSKYAKMDLNVDNSRLNIELFYVCSTVIKLELHIKMSYL